MNRKNAHISKGVQNIGMYVVKHKNGLRNRKSGIFRDETLNMRKILEKITKNI